MIYNVIWPSIHKRSMLTRQENLGVQARGVGGSRRVGLRSLGGRQLLPFQEAHYLRPADVNLSPTCGPPIINRLSDTYGIGILERRDPRGGEEK